MKDNKIKWPLLVGSIILCQIPGIAGSFFTAPAIPVWYAGLNKPSFNPPSWVFAPVWTLLYLLMGISLYLVLDAGIHRRQVKIAGGAFFIQLILNGLWSYLFFGLRSPLGAFFEIIFLWLAIALSMVLFFRIRPVAGWLLLPYILWVSFAGFLNYHIVILNPVP